MKMEKIHMENSEFKRQHGLERFMETQKKKYTCRKCGGVIPIHHRECQERRNQVWKTFLRY